jgi:hypothetical protein
MIAGSRLRPSFRLDDGHFSAFQRLAHNQQLSNSRERNCDLNATIRLRLRAVFTWRHRRSFVGHGFRPFPGDFGLVPSQEIVQEVMTNRNRPGREVRMRSANQFNQVPEKHRYTLFLTSAGAAAEKLSAMWSLIALIWNCSKCGPEALNRARKLRMLFCKWPALGLPSVGEVIISRRFDSGRFGSLFLLPLLIKTPVSQTQKHPCRWQKKL